MTNTTLEDKIKARLARAENKGIFYKGRAIAENLGNPKYMSRDETPAIRELDISYDEQTDRSDAEYGPVTTRHLTIKHKDKVVFESDGSGDDLKSYLPGRWEGLLEPLYQRAVRAREQQKLDNKAEEKKRADEELRKRARSLGIRV